MPSTTHTPKRATALLLACALVATSLAPSQAATTRAPFSISSRIARVSETHQLDASRVVFIIQDLHLHYPTQKRILSLLNVLDRKKLLQGKIALEGWTGNYDTSRLASFPSGKTKEKLIDYFLQQGELSGDEAFAVLQGRGDLLYGAEDPGLYRLNLSLFRSTYDKRKELIARLEHVRQQIDRAKLTHYSAALRAYERSEAASFMEPQLALREKEHICRTDIERRLVEADHATQILLQVLSQRASFDEARYVSQRLAQFVKITQRLIRLEPDALNDIQAAIDETIRSSADFYPVALSRDEPMASRALASMRAGQRYLTLIAGGFHTDGITAALRAKGVGYVVITPRIDNVESAYRRRYEQRLLGHHLQVAEVLRSHEGVGAHYLTEPDGRSTQSLRTVGQWLTQLGPGAIDIIRAASRRVVGPKMDEATQHWMAANAQDNDSATRVQPETTLAGAQSASDAVPANNPIQPPESPSWKIPTTNMAPEDELAQLKRFREALQSEIATPGAGRLPVVCIISDQHGTIDKFDALLLDAIKMALPGNAIPADFKLDPDRTLAEQLAYYRIQLPDDLRGRFYVHNLGDFMDRGDFGIKVFYRSVELIEMGLSDFVIGNHDFWMFMNLQGFHLPYYRGFNFYNYRDRYDEKYGRVEDIVTAQHADFPETLTKRWWAEKLAEYTQYQADRQKSHWNFLDERVNGKKQDGSNERTPGLFAKVKTSLVDESPEKRLWDQLRGWFQTDIYTGTRAVGGMSVVWWEELLLKFRAAYAALPASQREMNLPAASAWRQAIEMMEQEIIPELRRDLEAHLEQGQWWWRVFEAINSQNYTSPEWWAKDWVFHHGWGTFVLKELADRLGKSVTPSNYLDHRAFSVLSEFFRGHFRLYTRDIYQNVHMHAFLPVDAQTGEFHFTYKGQEYRGKGRAGQPSVWEGLDRLAADIQDRDNPLSVLYEALSLVNTWYADNTTIAKVPNVGTAINHFGPEFLAVANGVNRLSTGHLPFHEFQKLGDKLGYIKGFRVGPFYFIDHGMGEKFGSRGGWVYVGPEGMYLRGFERDGAEHIQAHPRTIGVVKGPNGPLEEVLFENPGMDRDAFLSEVLKNVEERIRELESDNTGPTAARIIPRILPAILGAVAVGFASLSLTAGSAMAAQGKEILKPAVESHGNVVSMVLVAVGLAASIGLVRLLSKRIQQHRGRIKAEKGENRRAVEFVAPLAKQPLPDLNEIQTTPFPPSQTFWSSFTDIFRNSRDRARAMTAINEKSRLLSAAA
jgi:hypothetical protein